MAGGWNREVISISGIMSNHRRKNAKKDQVMRVLTLICFFHFSGLNNGFAYFADSTGKVDESSFGSYAVAKCANVLNPLNWKSLVLDPVLYRLFPRSAQVIQYASNRAVRNMMVESSVFQMWVMDSCLRVAASFAKDPFSGQVSAADVNEPGGEMSAGAVRTGEPIPMAVFQSAQDNGFAFNGGERVYAMRDPLRYLDKDKRHSWIQDRHAVWNDFRAGRGEFFGNIAPWNVILPTGSGGAGPPLKVMMKNLVRFAPDRLIRRLTFASEPGDADSMDFAACGRMGITPRNRGDFFLGGNPGFPGFLSRKRERDRVRAGWGQAS